MSELSDAIKTLIDGAQGEALDVPHPNTLKNTEMTALTRWHRSEFPADFETNMLGAPEVVRDHTSQDFGKPLTYVRGQINRVTVLDGYNEAVGEPEYVVLHKVENPKVTDRDTSSSLIGPMNCRDLRRRFPGAFDEFEAKLRQEGTPYPIALLDDVPSHVIALLASRGTRTIEAFAAFGDAEMASLKATLEAVKLHARVPYLQKYLEMARAKVGYVAPVQAETPRPNGRKAA